MRAWRGWRRLSALYDLHLQFNVGEDGEDLNRIVVGVLRPPADPQRVCGPLTVSGPGLVKAMTALQLAGDKAWAGIPNAVWSADLAE